ncbi:unnamed protein product [Cryptosporidium hominis]|uniref:Uncharacterized protein n=1 Tax=Cryptosporidium hominis TaxID=237895 RepID=A0A0S4TM52_CRYHO|nr:hypothetical protein [Cryptosporidium hominis TU502]OLQ19312.1 hypothetical protein ChTU502y2012_421g0355 [Cryptosporidium hominis]PPA64687.1 hypothetical protein ChUKH1_01390 [Cryptosporidium hominis]PPS98286.1 Uncharacterized protein GY17_00000679 [Cryptosporidium hominis]CUV07795.1 unnamed protein product [Cryptosporidium hominis]|eukprot:PPS98286.1 Uncharacterized protein GY17_00000679 [Cryptosporidium hominis]
MFLSTINRLREEQEKSNSLRTYSRADAAKLTLLNIGEEEEGGRSSGEKGSKRVIRSSKESNRGKNKFSSANNDEQQNFSDIPKRKGPNKVVSDGKKISSFQQILNIAMTSNNVLKSSNRKKTVNREIHSNKLIPPSSYYDSIESSPNSSYNSDEQRSQEGSKETCEDTEDEKNSPKINFVRVICNGKGSDNNKSTISRTTSSMEKNEKKEKENSRMSSKPNRRLKRSDLDNVTNLESASKPSKVKKITKKDAGQSLKECEQVLDNNEESKSKDKSKAEESPGKRKTIDSKIKKTVTNTPKHVKKREKLDTNPGAVIQNSEEKPETYKQNILTLKAKNNLIKKRFKEQIDDDFFSNILVLTPSSSSSRKPRKSLNFEQSPSLTIFSPDTLDARLLKTGLTPVNNKELSSSGMANNKVSKRKELAKKGLESLHLSPLSSCLKEIASGEDTNRNSSYSKSSASKSIGDILGGLESTTGSKVGRLGRLCCEKQNKFVMQIHEKLTCGNFGDENKSEQNPSLQSKKSRTSTDKFKVPKGSLDLKMNLDSVLDQEMENDTRIADQEKQQELLWSITEDSSIQNEDRNLLVEELIAHTSNQ